MTGGELENLIKVLNAGDEQELKQVFSTCRRDYDLAERD
jgi:hypothetical protein